MPGSAENKGVPEATGAGFVAPGNDSAAVDGEGPVAAWTTAMGTLSATTWQKIITSSDHHTRCHRDVGTLPAITPTPPVSYVATHTREVRCFA